MSAKHQRFLNKFSEQIQFLQNSCEAFDRGLHIEAIRIAQSLRVLYHDGATQSLITQLNFNGKRMLSSAAKANGGAFDFLNFEMDLNSPTPVVTKPRLQDKFRELSIKEWWAIDTVFTFKNKKHTRRDIVKAAANYDGGAHVNAKLQEFYEALSKGLGDGISLTGNMQYNGEPPFEQGVNHSAKNTHLALLRQFAHEVFAALNHFNWLKSSSK